MGYRIIGPDGSASSDLDAPTLAAYARQGMVQPYTLIFDPTLGRAVPAAQVAALQGVFSPFGGPPAPPAYYGGGYPPAGAPPAPRRSVAAMAVAGLLAAIVVGFTIAGIAALKGIGARLDRKQTVVTADGRYAFQLSSLWQRHESDDPRFLEYLANRQGLVVMPLTGEAVSEQDLDDRTQRVEAAFASSAQGAPSSPITCTVGGYPAREFDYNKVGREGDLLHFRHTLISTPTGLYDITVFGMAYRADRDRKEQNALLASFHAVSPAAAGAPGAPAAAS